MSDDENAYVAVPFPEDDSREAIIQRTDGSDTLLSGERYPVAWAEVIALLANAAFREGYAEARLVALLNLERKADLVARTLAYAVGVQYEKGNFGMTHDPFPSEQEALACHGRENSCILKLFPDGSETVLWRWSTERSAWECGIGPGP